MAKVIRYKDKETNEAESFDSMFSRWKKKVKAEETLVEYQEHRYFKPKSIKRKEKSLRAAIRDKKNNKK